MSREIEPETIESEPADRGRRISTSAWLTLIAVVALGFLYTYYEWEAISSLLILPGLYAQNQIVVSSSLWTLLIAGVVLPPVIFVAALLVGRRRALVERVLIVFIGFVVVAATSLGILDLSGLI